MIFILFLCRFTVRVEMLIAQVPDTQLILNRLMQKLRAASGMQ